MAEQRAGIPRIGASTAPRVAGFGGFVDYCIASRGCKWEAVPIVCAVDSFVR
jgi:hypothetical protein